MSLDRNFIGLLRNYLPIATPLHLCYAHFGWRNECFMQLEWSIVPRGDVAPQASVFYVTMNRKGAIALNGTAYKRMGEPAAFLVMYNQANRRDRVKSRPERQ